ncbi:MAG: hypothetical protein JWN42_909 [Candidatus Angelobacter sp.]|nr:hypothetical protein [Candidatus Angelobacter sp.]
MALDSTMDKKTDSEPIGTRFICLVASCDFWRRPDYFEPSSAPLHGQLGIGNLTQAALPDVERVFEVAQHVT